jgi:membrane protease subunit HflK
MYFLAGVAVVWLLSGFYQVKANEVAVVERLGQYLSNTDGKIIELHGGLHYHLPWPIDRVQIIPNQQTLTLDVDEFHTSPDKYVDMKNDLLKQGMPPVLINALFDPYLITADKSIVNMQVKATYRVSDPTRWLTTVSHESGVLGGAHDMRQQLFQQLAQRALVHQLNHTTLEDVLYARRGEMPQETLNTLRRDFEVSDGSDPAGRRTLGLGIEIQKVDVSAIDPPEGVRPAFLLVSSARQSAERVETSAKGAAEAAKINAQGETSTMIAEATQYANTRVQAATGERDRFLALLEQYKNAPDVTQWNLWVDAVTAVSGPAVRHYFVQPGQRTIITIDPPKFDPAQVR